MKYRPKLDPVLKDISLTIVCIPSSVYLAFVLMFLRSETKGEDWDRWKDRCWKVVGGFACPLWVHRSF